MRINHHSGYSKRGLCISKIATQFLVSVVGLFVWRPLWSTQGALFLPICQDLKRLRRHQSTLLLDCTVAAFFSTVRSLQPRWLWWWFMSQGISNIIGELRWNIRCQSQIILCGASATGFHCKRMSYHIEHASRSLYCMSCRAELRGREWYGTFYTCQIYYDTSLGWLDLRHSGMTFSARQAARFQ